MNEDEKPADIRCGIAPGEVYAGKVWLTLKDTSDDFREEFVAQLRKHMCLNCGAIPGGYCCYDSVCED